MNPTFEECADTVEWCVSTFPLCMLSLVVILVLSYLAGSIPGSLWVGKGLYGVDLRKHGSGNPGATNAFGVWGWKAGLLATVVDMGKGALAAGLISGIRIDGLPFSGGAFWDAEILVQLLAGIAAVVGHMFPVFARFKGGKGVNTAAGALLTITPLTFLVVLLIFAGVLWATRYVSASSMSAAVSYPILLIVQKNLLGMGGIDWSIIGFGVVLALGIVLAHRSNLRRLMNGTESRISWVGAPTVEADSP